MVYVVFVLISFLASVIGCICGIGGGVIIKPVMDAFHIYSVSTVSFMSGCIVLSMTAYSVVKSRVSGESTVEKGTSTYLAIGAAIGGLAGKQLFDAIKSASANADAVGAVQAAALFALTLATVVYTLNKSRIRTHSVRSPLVCAVIGLTLGLMSSFLGIGGGPINLVVLGFFFSMDSKTAAQNSLYVILISQLASLIFAFVTRTVPDFPAALLAATVVCGIAGGAVGRRINKRIDSAAVDKLFVGLLAVIMCVCVYNFLQFRV